ncbi:MAG: DUF5689 domain-containing protein [Bacteroidota bacterium]
MKKQLVSILTILLVGFLSTTFTSCVKEDYDQPETANIDPALTVTHTLAQVRALATSATPIALPDTMILAGVVTADDESGNFYKEMVIQDSTAGVSILLDLSNYNTNYPIGRRVFIKCKDLYVAKDQYGTVEIGVPNAGEVGRIPGGLVSQYLIPGKWDLPLPIQTTTLANLNANIEDYIQKIVNIQGVEFQVQDMGIVWSAAGSYNRTLKDCGTQELVVYTSSYANFASKLTPNGKGNITGIIKVYGSSGELIVRNELDADMKGATCDSALANAVEISIDSLRSVFTGTTTSAPTGTKIIGTVISDISGSNLDTKNMVIQNGTTGIVVRFTSAHPFAVGDQVQVIVSDQEVSEYYGWLQVNNVPNGYATKIGTGTVTPRTATISDVLANFDAWESTLVTISDVTISGGTTVGNYGGNTTLTDPTGTLAMYTRSSATFSTTAYPTGAVGVTGILSEYSRTAYTPQLLMRTAADVQ